MPFIDEINRAIAESMKAKDPARLAPLRMLKAAGQAAPESKPILEINPNHPLVTRLKYEDAASPRFGDWANILFDQAMLAEGGQLADPAAFVRRLNEMLLATAK